MTLRPSGENPDRTRLVRSRRLARCLGACVLGASMLAAGCRLDMHVQPKYKPDRATDFFGDGRSDRPLVPHTVIHDQLPSTDLLHTGRIDGVVANVFPFAITEADMLRGRQRYDIYCAPCHDYNGTGQGMIVLRGFPSPPSYHIDRLRNAPVGHFFEVMTDGFGQMYSYAARVSPEDRWRIAAYIRALQLSRNATMDDVPQSERAALQAQSATSASQP